MAASSRPVDLFVDTAERDRLGGEHQTLQIELGDLVAQGMNADPAALGGDAAGAADRFTTHWNDERAHIAENFGECPTRADGATHTCPGAETVIHEATRPPSGPANPETP